MKVLIVEDNEDYREILGLFLGNQGFDVVFAVNGEEAIERAQGENPSIILMDLNLPVMDGWEATRAISRDAATAHIPIVAISANCSYRGREILEAGAVGCVQKPVDIETLPDLILNYANNSNG